jgi:hypothetical protein
MNKDGSVIHPTDVPRAEKARTPMRKKPTVTLTATALCAAAIGISVPAQATAATAKPAGTISSPLPCTTGGYLTPTGSAVYYATCTAPAGQEWQAAIECRDDNPRYPVVFHAWGNVVTGDGTSYVTCGTTAGAYDNTYVVLD